MKNIVIKFFTTPDVVEVKMLYTQTFAVAQVVVYDFCFGRDGYIIKSMATYILRFRKTDKFVFDSIKNGEKTIETRAATIKFREIKAGDILVFDCAGERLEKEVKGAATYKSIDELVRDVDFKKVMPFVSSAEEMKKVYYGFTNYKEKIKQFGLIAFELK